MAVRASVERRAASPCKLRGVPVPKTCRMMSPRFRAAAMSK